MKTAAQRTSHSAWPDLPPESKSPSRFRKMLDLKLVRLFRDSFARWSEEKGTRLGAALAYYTAFSLAPLLILTIAIAGLVFGKEAAQGQIVGQLSGVMGRPAAQVTQNMLEAANKPSSGVVATVIGLFSLLIGASGVMTEMKDALNRIWKVEGGTGLSGFLRTKLKAISMVLAVGFLLLVSLVFSAALSAVGKYFEGILPIPEVALQAINVVVSYGVVTFMFAILFKFLPDARVRWHDVWIGSLMTSGLFVLGKFGLELYLGKGAIGSSYGAAGAILIVLAWVYYSAQILYFGAAFTKVYAERFGSGVKPD
jgi:membrane protein